MAVRHGQTVFVGNLSFDCSEEDIRSLFSQVGPVSQLRLVVDHSTGKRKGFGFIEFLDAETALSAVRNLNDIEFHGRPLRVSVAEQDAKGAVDVHNKRRRLGGSCTGGNASAAAAAARSRLENAAHSVAITVDGTASAQLFAVLKEAQGFAADHPAQAKALMLQQPQLYHALRLALDRLCGAQGGQSGRLV